MEPLFIALSDRAQAQTPVIARAIRTVLPQQTMGVRDVNATGLELHDAHVAHRQDLQRSQQQHGQKGRKTP